MANQANEQQRQNDVRDVGLENHAYRAQNQRCGERSRGDQRRFAAGLEEPDQAARHQQHDVNPEDSCRIHNVSGKFSNPRPGAR